MLSGPSGQVDLTRDPDGLVSRVDVDAGPTRSVVTSRHPDGRPQSVQHDGHTITFGYDATTRELTSLETEDGITVSLDTDGPLLESVTWSGSAGVAGAVAFGYDELWDLSTITAGGLATSYHYDEDGALDCVAPGGTADSTCASGLLIVPNLPAGTLVMSMAGAASVMSSYEWSDLGEATQTVHQWSTTGELSFTYDERDGEGRLTRVIEDDGAGGLVLEYRYDVEGRLIEVKRDGVVSESYEYDPNGQRITATRDGVPVAPIAWDARDRLTQYGGVAYEYDPAGRRTTRTEGGRTTTYTYDRLGALRAVDLPDTTDDIEYLIDGAGRRVGRKIGPIGSGTLERAWIYLDDLRPIVEMDGSGTVTRIFVYGAGRAPDLIVVPAGQPDAGTYRVLTDHLDSVRRVVNAESGAVIQQLDYDAFGNVLVDTNPGWQPFGFAAGLYDPGARDPACVLAGGRYCGALVRFGARDYDPEIGLWTARDPILFGGGDGNLYLYSSGDPRNHIDATGRNPVAVAVGVVVIAAMLWALNPNHAGDIGRKSVKRSACGRSLPNTVWIGAAIEADGGYADMAVDAAIHLVTLGVASELSVLSTRFATSAVVRNSWFRLDTVGRWRSIVTRQWQSGTHFHFDPFPGSRELMRWHLPHELKPWLYNARSIVRRYVSRSRR
ncbi:MAG: RHS repeat-associated core domain-containing protein [Sandaracinaceae bacterium]|nr:RHS repeat-associated core domain-containing protein [Sandaracinaceae bacterium]